jgi:hypothetical protein
MFNIMGDNMITRAQRILILVHPDRNQASISARRMPVAMKEPKSGEPLFCHNLYLYNELTADDVCPDGNSWEKLFSHDGSIAYDDLQKLSINLLARNPQQIFLAGGDVEHCLFRAFKSLARIKANLGVPLNAIITDPLIYGIRKQKSIERIREEKYLGWLNSEFAKGVIDSFSFSIDDRDAVYKGSGSKNTSLSWFTSLPAMFRSGFFPELKGSFPHG